MLPDLDHMSSPHFIHDPPIPNNAVLADMEDFINYFVSPPAILSVASCARRGGGANLGGEGWTEMLQDDSLRDEIRGRIPLAGRFLNVWRL